MIDESNELNKLIQDLYEKNKDLSEDFTSIQLSEDKWSVKEIFGHLIDSAANNYQRFIRLQKEKELSFPGYGTDWIKIVPYNSYPFSSLLTLWKEYNLLLCHIFENLEKSDLQNTWNTESGKLTLEFLVRDYISHLRLHIKHLEERMTELP